MLAYIIRGGEAGPRAPASPGARDAADDRDALFERAGCGRGYAASTPGAAAATYRSIWRAASVRGAAWSGRDLDEVKLAAARAEAAAAGMANVEFHTADLVGAICRSRISIWSMPASCSPTCASHNPRSSGSAASLSRAD